jgi:heat shock protein HslJ
MAKRISIMLIAVLCVGAFVLSAGCIGGQQNLDGTSWRVTGFSDGAAPASVISLTFSADGSAGGSGGVNAYSASYTTDPAKGALTFTQPVSTLMAGPQNYMNDESRYFTTLATVTGYKVENGNLILTGSDGATLLTFAPALSDTTWELVSYTPYSTGQLTGTIGTVTLNLGKDDRYSANSGINQLTGTWSQNGTALTISEPASTRMTGTPRLETQEAYYKLLLPSATGYYFSMGQLFLTDAEGKIILTYKKPLADSGWTLIRINGAEPYSGARAVTLNLNADGTAAGTAPVNSYSGQWSVSGADSIALDNIATTLMAGLDPNANSYETEFLAILNNVTTYALGGNGLTLSADDGKTLEFVANPENIIKSYTWTLAGNNAVTFRVAEDSTVSGQAQVNTYRGPAVFTAPDGISMGPFITTRMSGTAKQNSDETAYLAALESAKTCDINDGQLVLKNAAGTAVLTFNPQL